MIRKKAPCLDRRQASSRGSSDITPPHRTNAGLQSGTGTATKAGPRLVSNSSMRPGTWLSSTGRSLQPRLVSARLRTTRAAATAPIYGGQTITPGAVATDIDQKSTYVGGNSACIDAIITDPRLEAFPVSGTQFIGWAADTVNPHPPHGT